MPPWVQLPGSHPTKGFPPQLGRLCAPRIVDFSVTSPARDPGLQTIRVSKIPVIELGVCFRDQRRVKTQVWLFRPRDVDLREAQFSALSQLFGWLVATAA
jgi:hypothetical protein